MSSLPDAGDSATISAMLKVHHRPELRSPVLLAAFSGWGDAAASASGGLGYLSMKWGNHPFAELDPEVIFDYSLTRPTAVVGSDGVRELHWPELTMSWTRPPHLERDLLLLVGPEPDLKWQACSRALAELAGQVGVELVFTLGSFAAGVSHADSVPLFGLSTDPELIGRLRRMGLKDPGYQGPTSFASAMSHAAAERGLPSVSLWAAAPSYIAGMSNPKVSVALLQAVEAVLDVKLGLDELVAAGRDLEARVDQALRERPDLRRFVRGLSREEARGEEATEERQELGELPPTETIVKSLEDYLRQLRSQGDGQQES